MPKNTKMPPSFNSDFQAILQKMQSPLTLADASLPDAPIVAANSAFIELTGYSLAKIIGLNCRVLQADHENQETRAEIRECLVKGRRTQVVLRNRHVDGTDFWNYLTIIPISILGAEKPHLFLGAQFILSDQEVQSLNAPIGLQAEKDVSGTLGRHRLVTLERRRLSIEAAIRLVEGNLLLRSVRGQS